MPRQQSIPGTDVQNPVIEDLIERWLERLERKKAAAEAAAEADDAIVLKMVELGVPYHPYTDPETGKRKYRVVDTTPRGKSISARPADPVKPDEPELSESTPVERPERATHRKVSRKAAKKEIDAERAHVESRDNPDLAQGAAAVDGALRPAREWDDAS